MVAKVCKPPCYVACPTDSYLVQYLVSGATFSIRGRGVRDGLGPGKNVNNTVAAQVTQLIRDCNIVGCKTFTVV